MGIPFGQLFTTVLGDYNEKFGCVSGGHQQYSGVIRLRKQPSRRWTLDSIVREIRQF